MGATLEELGQVGRLGKRCGHPRTLHLQDHRYTEMFLTSEPRRAGTGVF